MRYIYFVKQYGSQYFRKPCKIIIAATKGIRNRLVEFEDGHRFTTHINCLREETKLRPPIKWIGGKATKTHHLLPYICEHRIYVEPFGGAAALLFAKEPSPVEIYNDINHGVVDFYRLLRDQRKFREFRKR